MKFSIENARKSPHEGFTAYVYNSKEQCPALNTIYVDCFEGHDKVYVKKSHRLYFVIEGSGIFYVGKEKHEVKQNDVIAIEPMVEYSYCV